MRSSTFPPLDLDPNTLAFITFVSFKMIAVLLGIKSKISLNIA